jgi:hypothetical protein
VLRNKYQHRRQKAGTARSEATRNRNRRPPLPRNHQQHVSISRRKISGREKSTIGISSKKITTKKSPSKNSKGNENRKKNTTQFDARTEAASDETEDYYWVWMVRVGGIDRLN